jgi:hypothetical protein
MGVFRLTSPSAPFASLASYRLLTTARAAAHVTSVSAPANLERRSRRSLSHVDADDVIGRRRTKRLASKSAASFNTSTLQLIVISDIGSNLKASSLSRKSTVSVDFGGSTADFDAVDPRRRRRLADESDWTSTVASKTSFIDVDDPSFVGDDDGEAERSRVSSDATSSKSPSRSLW